MKEEGFKLETDELTKLKEDHEKLKCSYSESLKEITTLKNEVHEMKHKNNIDNSVCVDDTEDNLSNAKVIVDGKQKGFTREGPQSKPIAKPVVQQQTCQNCNKTFEGKTELTDHMQTHTNDGDWNCDECAHQTNSLDNLKKHLNATHHKSKHATPFSEKIPCNFCATKFGSNTELEEHRRKSHKTFKPFRNLPNCPYESNCLFNHNTIDTNMFLCYECGLAFNIFSDLMFHRKTKHTMNKCSKFSENDCKFTGESCWYNHSEVSSDKFKNQTAPQEKGFWDPPPTINRVFGILR